MTRVTCLLLPLLVVGLMALGCDKPVIEATNNVFDFETPCAATEAGSCTWVDDNCDFAGVTLDFCGLASAPPSCFQGREELVAGIVVIVPPVLNQGLDVTCTLVDGGNPQDPANATVCLYPLSDDSCEGPWPVDSDYWDQNRELTVRFASSAGAKIIVVDVDASLCNALSITCQAR